MAQLTYFVPGVSEEHAEFIFNLFKAVDDTAAQGMVISGIISTTEEGAQEFIDRVTGGYDRLVSTVHRFYAEIPPEMPAEWLTAIGLTVVE